MGRRSFGFGREHRIRSSRDFQRIYRQGELLQDEYFRVFYCPSRDGVPRLGLSVGKGLGKAVLRNRLKRALREAFRLNKDLFAGLELIVQPKQAAAHLPGKEVQERFLALARRLPRGPGIAHRKPICYSKMHLQTPQGANEGDEDGREDEGSDLADP